MAHAGRALGANAGYTRLNASPTLDVATPAGVLFESGPIFKDNQYVSGSVQMKLAALCGRADHAGIDAAHDAPTGASEIERATAATLKLDVAESYVAVLRARRALQAAASSVESLTAHVGDVQQMVESESVARSDLSGGSRGAGQRRANRGARGERRRDRPGGLQPPARPTARTLTRAR